ncbi:MAG: Ig-like domain-containing protein [Patescibacteria group bacterium]
MKVSFFRKNLSFLCWLIVGTFAIFQPLSVMNLAKADVAVGTSLWGSSTLETPTLISTIKSEFEATTLDNYGSVYAVGYIYGDGVFNFGNGVTATGVDDQENAVLVKYNSLGVAQWAKAVVTAPSVSRFYGVSLDSAGNIYAVGYIYTNGTFGFGNGVTVSGSYNQTHNIVLVKYNSLGEAEWAQSTAAATSSSIYYGVAVDSSGNIFAVGHMSGLLEDPIEFGFGNGVTISTTYSGGQVLLVKYNSSGAAEWAKSTTVNPGGSRFLNVSISDVGNILVSGFISGTSTFDFGNSVTVAGGYASGTNGLTVLYNSSGVAQWAHSISGQDEQSELLDVSFDSSENAYAVGYIVSNQEFSFGDGITATGAKARGERDDPGNNTVLIKYDSSGITQWAKTTVVALGESGYQGISISSNGIFAVGYIVGTSEYNFGNDVTISGNNSGKNAVIVKYDFNGQPVWAHSTVVAPDISEFKDVMVDSENNAYSVGYITGKSNYYFGDRNVAGGNSDSNIIVIKYAGETTNGPAFIVLPNDTRSININEGQTITTNPYVINVRPQDPDGISRVDFLIDDNLICSINTSDSDKVYSCSWDTSKYHSEVKVYAYDISGNQSSVLLRNTLVASSLHLTTLPETGR